MKKNKIIRNTALTMALLSAGITALQAQKTAKKPNEAYIRYEYGTSPIYKKGWIDFNKNGVMDVYENPDADIDDRIENLLSQMNTDEKTCQMVTLYGYGRVLQDDLPTPEWKNKLWKDGMGAIDEHLNGFRQWGLPPSDNPYVWPASKHAWAMNEVQRFFVEETRLGIPTDFTNEGIRGVENYIATNFPTQLGIGHTWNRELAGKIGKITGSEARALGYTNVYAPILDVGRDQRWGRYEEVYGESPYLVAEMGVAMAKGLQDNYQVAATAKHYIAYSNNKGAREGMARVDPQMSPRELENIHVYPFREVIGRAGILGVMSSYNDYDGLPIQSSKYWLTDRLRGEMGFKGYVVSDSDAVEYLYTKHHTAEDMKEAVRQSVEAGLNIRCTFRSPDSYVLPLRELIDEGGIDTETIDDRVRDILRVKFLIGLFDNPYQTDLKAADELVNCEAHRQIALQASRESIVLLKNKDKILPLDLPTIKTIAVCGPNADEKSYALTHYGPLAVEVTTVLEGIRAKAEGKAQVIYTKGCDLVDATWPDSELIPVPLTDEEKQEIGKAVEQARQADVAVVVLGGGVRTCGENKSRSSLELPGHQLQLLQAVQATGKPVIVVLINGRPLSVNWAQEHADAILEAWYPGSQGGTALADVLFGDYNPGGKLTVTFPKSAGQIPFNFPAKPSSQIDGGRTPGLKGNMSRVNGPLYPFGFGLSYTTFEYSDLQIEPETITTKQNTTVRFKVTNTGDRVGDEVVQLYLRDKISSVTTYEKVLRGFDRIHLEPGETKEITFTITPKNLELVDAQMNRVVEPGEFEIMAGASSQDIKLRKTLTVVRYGDSGSPVIREQKNNGSVTASVSQETAGNAIDRNPATAWKAGKGDYLTLALKEGAKPGQMTVDWKNVQDDSKFEIQLSGGGGQFLTVHAGTVKKGQEGSVTYSFDATTASDIRLLVVKGALSVAEISVPEMKR